MIHAPNYQAHGMLYLLGVLRATWRHVLTSYEGLKSSCAYLTCVHIGDSGYSRPNEIIHSPVVLVLPGNFKLYHI